MLDKSKHEDAAAGRIALLHKNFVSDVRSQPIPVRQQISNRPSTSIEDMDGMLLFTAGGLSFPADAALMLSVLKCREYQLKVWLCLGTWP